MRAAIAAALGDFKGDEGAFSTETKLLQSDPSYAIHAATAIGASSDQFDVLSEHFANAQVFWLGLPKIRSFASNNLDAGILCRKSGTRIYKTSGKRGLFIGEFSR